jgi:hypothetical protein
MTFEFNPSEADKFLKDCDTLIQEWYEKISTPTPELIEEIKQNLTQTLKPIGDAEIWLYGFKLIGVQAGKSLLGLFVDLGGKFYSSNDSTAYDERKCKKIEEALIRSPDWAVKSRSEKSSQTFMAYYKRLNAKCK